VNANCKLHAWDRRPDSELAQLTPAWRALKCANWTYRQHYYYDLWKDKRQLGPSFSVSAGSLLRLMQYDFDGFEHLCTENHFEDASEILDAT
jgi:hypothetical protein